jgi:hypothetical protein
VPIWPVLLHTILSCTFADGYIFEKNTDTGNIDLSHRTKPFNGTETTEIYHNCTNLKLTNKIGKDPKAQSNEELILLLTSQFSEKQIPTGIFTDTPFGADLHIAIEAINTFIETVVRDKTTNRNNSATVHNLFCTIQEYDRQCTREYESLLLSPIDNPDFDECNNNNSTLTAGEENGYVDACTVQVISNKEDFRSNLPIALCVKNPTLYVQSSYS